MKLTKTEKRASERTREAERKTGAYHEAGHAALMLHFGWRLEVATASETRCTCYKNEQGHNLYHSLEQVYQQIIILHAGYVAVKLSNKSLSYGAASLLTGSEDLRRVCELLKRFQIPRSVDRQLETDTQTLVKQVWPKVREIAQSILERGSFYPSMAR